MTEEKSDAFEQHVKRYEKRLKTAVIIIVAFALYVVWFMLHPQ